MTTQDALALEIATLDARIKRDSEQLNLLKAELVQKVGDGGATIELTTATVTITQQTQDRATGQFVFALDVNTFAAQDERVQANLVKQGIVSKTQKVTKGQAPSVRVKAK